MKSLDCGNHRTGQPRCAQLIANTWNWSPPIRRTQHAIFAVGPSQATRNGFSYVARRVCPSGKFPTEPSLIHACPARPRTGPKMYPMIGIPASVAARPLSAKPSVNRNPRRDGGDGSKSWFAHIVSDSSRCLIEGRHGCAGAPRALGGLGGARSPPCPLCDEPGDDVRDLLRRERAARDVAAPVGHADVRASRDHRRAQVLIADEREIRGVHDRARLRPAATVRAMAARTGRGVDFTPSFRISELRGIRRNAHTLHGGGTRPRCQEPLHQRVDLLVGQRPARAGGEGGLRRARYALGNDLAEPGRRNEPEINRVIEGARGAEPAIATVAARALLLVERVKGRDLRGHGLSLLACSRSAGQDVAAGQARGEQHREYEVGGPEMAPHTPPRSDAPRRSRGAPRVRHRMSHRSRSCSERARDASTPARAASGQVCIVASGCARATTNPAASPKAICETTNHGQSTRAASVGSTIPSRAQTRPVHRSGAMTPPQNMWRRGSIGRMTAYRRPTSTEMSP